MSVRAGLRRRGPLLLALSLGLNIFLVGWLGANRLACRSDGASLPEPPPEVMLERIAHHLPQPDAQRLHDVFSTRQDAIHKARQDYIDALDRLSLAVTTQPFDQQAFRKAAAETRAAHEIVRAQFGDALLDAISQFSPEGRAAFASSHFIHHNGDHQ